MTERKRIEELLKMIMNETRSTLTNFNHFLLLSVWHKVSTLSILQL